jgi:TolB protein
VLQATFERTRPIRQHRTILGWRPSPMRSTTAAIAVGAVAIVIAAFAITQLPRSSSPAGGVPSPEPTATPPGSASPEPSPKVPPVTGLPGRFAFASDRDGDYDIYVMNPDRTRLTQLTDAEGDDVRPVWSRDGSRIAFASDRDGDYDIFIVDADGTNERRLADEPGDQLPGDWSSDGGRLAYSTEIDGTTAVSVVDLAGTNRTEVIRSGEDGIQFVAGASWTTDDLGLIIVIDKTTTGGEIDVYRLDLDDRRLTNLTNAPGDDSGPALSPDRSTIAFQTDRLGGCLAVMNADGTGVIQLATTCGATPYLSWSPDGARIGWAGDHNRGGPADIRVILPDGGAALQLTNTGDIVDLAWGPASP